ncbi:hypothetical protein Tco_0728016 [Tanacetum coccineum]|uniref:Uncharacterized protein n=1 Tax=Tanacetum coccineum TaxID=301880 RepID=A0ABQ4YKJ2_9ASTR
MSLKLIKHIQTRSSPPPSPPWDRATSADDICTSSSIGLGLWSAIETAFGQCASGLGLGLWSAVETASSQRASGFGLGLWSAVETTSGQRASGLGLGMSRAVFGCGNKIKKIRKLQRPTRDRITKDHDQTQMQQPYEAHYHLSDATYHIHLYPKEKLQTHYTSADIDNFNQHTITELQLILEYLCGLLPHGAEHIEA